MCKSSSDTWGVDVNRPIISIILLFPFYAHAASVFVRGSAVGQGVTRSRGPECFLITAAHLTQNKPTADVIVAPGIRGEADIEMNLAKDISILRITSQSSSFCPTDQDWSIGPATDPPPNSVKAWTLEMTNETGTVQTVPVTQISFDPQYIFVERADGKDFQEEMSGSPIRADGRLAGILLNLKGKTGTVFRLRYIDGIIQGIFRTTSGAVPELTLADLERIDTNIAIAKVALDRQDCGIAVQSLSSVPEGGHSAIWMLYMARAYECTTTPGQSAPDLAFTYYQKYDQLVPGQKDILEKIAVLGYEAQKRARVQEEKRLEAQRLEALKSDLSGTWRDSNGRIIVIEQSGTSVTFIRSNEQMATGSYIDGTFTGTWVAHHGPDVKENCPEHPEYMKPIKGGISLRISSDGMGLAGKRDVDKIYWDHCEQRIEEEEYDLRRQKSN